MTYQDIVKKVSQELNLSEDIVDSTYKAYWKSIKEMVQQLPLKDDMSEEEFQKLRTNFNIPSLGKLCCTQDRYINMKKRFEYIKHLREKKC